MLLTNTALWRIAFLSGFGILPAACGGNARDTPGPGGTSKAVGTDPEAHTDETPQTAHETRHAAPSPLRSATACIDSVPILDGDIDTGLERCSDGRSHRPASVQCVSKLPRPAPTPTNIPPAQDGGCSSDSDCTAAPHGYCAFNFPAAGPPFGWQCEYGCLSDADCGAGSICQCGDPVGTCEPADCTSDADCGSGFLCSEGEYAHTLGCDARRELRCEKPADQCQIGNDCPPSQLERYCALTDSARVCAVFDGGSCGRPFLVDGSARLARVERTHGWLTAGTLAPECEQLSAAQRRELAQAWARLGSMEHASIAAFARFTLQLLSLGAPAALVEQSQRALADELLHARLCFGLASAYSGEPMGPGALPMQGALDQSSLEEIAVLTLHEGCVGETIAALEASEALALASDPAVRDCLARIHEDERRHAELAWRFVRWAVRVGGASVQSRIQRELAQLVSGAPSSAMEQEMMSFDSSSHGILSARQRSELRAAALRDVVLPCAQQLLPVEPRRARATPNA